MSPITLAHLTEQAENTALPKHERDAFWLAARAFQALSGRDAAAAVLAAIDGLRELVDENPTLEMADHEVLRDHLNESIRDAFDAKFEAGLIPKQTRDYVKRMAGGAKTVNYALLNQPARDMAEMSNDPTLPQRAAFWLAAYSIESHGRPEVAEATICEVLRLREQCRFIASVAPDAALPDNVLAGALAWRIRAAVGEIYAANGIPAQVADDLLALFPVFDPKASARVDRAFHAADKAPGLLRFSDADFTAAVAKLKGASK